jgi:hypothetical protein
MKPAAGKLIIENTAISCITIKENKITYDPAAAKLIIEHIAISYVTINEK